MSISLSEKASGLNGEARKKYAEKVILNLIHLPHKYLSM